VVCDAGGEVRLLPGLLGDLNGPGGGLADASAVASTEQCQPRAAMGVAPPEN